MNLNLVTCTHAFFLLAATLLVVDDLSSDNLLKISVTLNDDCIVGPEYLVEVTFAVLMEDEDNSSCGLNTINKTNQIIAPGMSATFSTEITDQLQPQMYCYVVSLDGERGK